MGKGIVKLGEGNWAVKDGKLLAAKETNGRFKNAEFTVARGTDATYVDRDGLIANESGDDTPRIDFTDNTDGHLLLEPQSTNLITYSEDFTKWSKEATVTLTPNYGISPDGTQNSTRMQMNSNDSVYISKSSGLTASFYVKGTLGETIRFSNGSGITHTLTGNWDRVEVYDISSVSSLISINTYSGATATDIEIWGAQAEALSHSTSYIPTNGSTVTRDAETCTGAGETADFNSEEGVLYAEIAALADDSTYRFISLNGGGYSNSIRIGYFTTSNTVEYRVVDNSAKQVEITHVISDTTDTIKLAAKYKANDFALWINGVEVATDTSGTIPSNLYELDFNDGNASNNSPFYGKVKAIRVYKEALSDTDLQNLTS